MDRIYRIKQGTGGRYAVERDGQFYWLKGEVFGAYELGEAVPAGPSIGFSRRSIRRSWCASA